MTMDHNSTGSLETKQAAQELKRELEAEFPRIRVEVDLAVEDPDTEHAYFWLDGAGADTDEYADAWDYSNQLVAKLWQERDLFFVVKARNAPEVNLDREREPDFE